MIRYIYNPPYNHWSGNRTGNTNKWKIIYKGSVPTTDDLPAEGEFSGEVYNVLENSKYYMWNGSSWEEFSVNTYIGATSSSDGIQGLVPPATSNQIYNVLTGGGTWENAESLGLALDSDVLHKTGVETVTGEKIFSGIQTTINGNESALMVVKDPALVKGETPESVHYLSLGFIDSTGNSYAQDQDSRLGVFEYKSPSASSPTSLVQMAARDFYGGSGNAVIQVGYDADGIMFSRAPATSNERTASTDIVTRGYLEASEWNWQKTLKASSVQFVPVPDSNLEPVVDFIFTETPPAEGDKGPDNPSTIAGVSSITVTRCRYVGVVSNSYVIPLEDTYYGGSLDVATGVLTVTRYGMVVTGDEAWDGFYTPGTGRVQLNLESSPYKPIANQAGICSCSHYQYINDNTNTDPHWAPYSDGQICLYDSFDSLQAFKDFMAAQYAAGTPIVMVWAIEPFTVQLAPTHIKSLVAADKYIPRTNMIYSDQQAVQVGYQRFYHENRLAAIEARIEALEASQG